MILLRVIHILCGLFWVGSAITATFFVLPSIIGAGPNGGPVMEQFITVRKYPIWAAGAGVLTILSGLTMYWRNNVLSNGAFSQSRPGMTYGIAALIAIVAAILGSVITGRTAAKLAVVGAAVKASGGPPSAQQITEMAVLRARLKSSSTTATLLLIVVATLMAVARYL